MASELISLRAETDLLNLQQVKGMSSAVVAHNCRLSSSGTFQTFKPFKRRATVVPSWLDLSTISNVEFHLISEFNSFSKTIISRVFPENQPFEGMAPR